MNFMNCPGVQVLWFNDWYQSDVCLILAVCMLDRFVFNVRLMSVRLAFCVYVSANLGASLAC